MVQRMGLLLAITVLQRIKKILGSSVRPAILDTFLTVDLSHYLPDIELLVNTRARLVGIVVCIAKR